MKVVEKKIEELIPYAKNPRKNDAAIDKVAASIREFGFKVPVVIDNGGVIVAGHTRVEAAKKLGLKTVPAVIADDLSEEQIKAFRLADNKTAELADWDFELLDEEIQDISDIDMSEFGFGISDWFEDHERNDDSHQEGNEEYNKFLDKFEMPKTTDDCYTPDIVYDAVAEWVATEYDLDRGNFVRPFYPGGDYQKRKYKGSDVVVDNPPFSILSEILKFYTEKGVRFFLFAPALTLFSSSSSSSCAIGIGVAITYENKANVATSFLTNLEMEHRFRTSPTLYKAVEAANDKNLEAQRKDLQKNDYPDHVITSTKLSYFSKYGVDYAVRREKTVHIRALDAQKEKGQGIFGSGYLVSEKAAAEKAAAEKAAAEKAAAEKAAAEKAAAEKAAAEKAAAEKWQLSDREMAIVKQLDEEKDMEGEN